MALGVLLSGMSTPILPKASSRISLHRLRYAMGTDESGHRRMLVELYRQKFGEHISLIRRQNVKGFVPRKPVWLMRPLRLEAVPREPSAIEVETQARLFLKVGRASNFRSGWPFLIIEV